jgi:DtxR family Mn-dependent transcriptional regulator
MRPGTKCVVRRIQNRRSAARRLVEMGVRRGTVIDVERVAPLGDPIAIKVRGCRLVLRREEARTIEVVPA